MISKVLSQDIFSGTKQPGEDKIRIVCGTNNLGDNSTALGSIAGQIGENLHKDFLKFPEGLKSMGEVYKRSGELHGDNADFLAIVCNQVQGLITDKNRIWQFAAPSLKNGFEEIYQDDTVVPSKESRDKIAGEAFVAMEEKITLNASTPEKDGVMIEDIQGIIDGYKNQINPILRTPLIGNGDSGRINNANLAAILTVMQEVPNNLHLYLLDRALLQQMAVVIQLNPQLRTGALKHYYAA